jgi:hypothetical protein
MSKKKRRKRLGELGLNRHHWTNKINGGKSNKRNVSWLKVERHRAWHYIFKNKSLEEVIALLTRLKKMKGG